MRLLNALSLSCMLWMMGCQSLPPCNREDVTKHPDGSYTINQACWKRIVGDLDACYPSKFP